MLILNKSYCTEVLTPSTKVGILLDELDKKWWVRKVWAGFDGCSL